MIPLTRLKKDVQFNGELTKVVDVLKGISVARYYVLEKQLSRFEEFFKVCGSFLQGMDLEHMDHPFTRSASSTAAVLMITSDAGFLGGLNNQVVSLGLSEGGPEARFSVVGEKGAGLLRDQHKVFTLFPGIEDSSRLVLATAIRDHLVRQILSVPCGRLLVIFPEPVSFSVQRVRMENLIPITKWENASPGKRSASPTLWESRPEDVVEYVVAQWMVQRLATIFALSRLAELAARFIHLEGSYQELLRLGKKLQHQYFRSRHEVIDRSMREIFAAQLLYKSLESHE